jgi:predicted DNA-binding antitoxin AbrB/MazE fold protein
MSRTIEALYDGTAFRPAEPITLEPNTRVWIVIETILPVAEQGTSFLRIARSLNLEGPADWSANFEGYLYGGALTNEN